MITKKRKKQALYFASGWLGVALFIVVFSAYPQIVSGVMLTALFVLLLMTTWTLAGSFANND